MENNENKVVGSLANPNKNKFAGFNSLEVANVAIHLSGAMQKLPEFAALLDLVASGQPRIIMEIGCGKGGTAWAWSKIASLKRLILLDLPNGPWGGTELDESIKYLQDITDASIIFIKGNSQNSEALEAVKRSLIEVDSINTDLKEIKLAKDEIDVLFIDGDHSYEGVKADFLTYSPLVKDGGLVVFHDICEHPAETKCDVKKFWDELKEASDNAYRLECIKKLQSGEVVADKEDDLGVHAEFPKNPNYAEFISDPINWGGIGVLLKI